MLRQHRALGAWLMAVAMCISLVGLTACEANKQTGGGILGGVAGGILGSQFGSGSGKTAATIAGVLIGAGVGSYIGKRMDDADRAEMSRTLEYNKTGRPNTWRNPDTGTQYEVTPTSTYRQESGRYCREYTTEIWVDGQKETAYGTACRQPDGRWKIVESS